MTARLAATSAWLGGRPGLTEAALEWSESLEGDRRRILDEAGRLATPRLARGTARALIRLVVRFLWFTVTGVIGALMRRNPLARNGRGAARGETPAVRRAQDLVRAGGPAYVKLGQLIATARGALPDEWTEAFAWCRDEVPALAPGVAGRVIGDAFGRPPTELFAWINPEPVAAASIAQVHLARLADGTDVAVKVQRPGLRQWFEADIAALAVIAAAADRFSTRARIANLPGFVELFAQLVLEEIDFRLEAHNMVEIGLANEDAGLDYLRIPRPIPDLVNREVLVMERVPGVRYTDVATNGSANGTRPDGHRLVRLAVQGILEHALLYGVFHGDLHAGNVLIDEEGRFSLVDFGIVGRVDHTQREALIRLVIGFARQDAAAQVAAAAEFGALPPGFDLQAVAAEERSLRPETEPGAKYASTRTAAIWPTRRTDESTSTSSISEATAAVDGPA